MRLFKTIKIAFLFLPLLSLAACEHTLAPRPEKPGKPEEPSLVFSEHVLPIFHNNCAFNGCHGEQNAQVGLQFLTWDTIVRGSDAGEVIIPFVPEQSLMIEMVSGIGQPRMPFNSTPLDSATIDTLRQWIAMGAKTDGGTVPYSNPGPRLFVPNRGDDWVSIIDPEFLTVGRIVNSNPDSMGDARPVAVTAGAERWYLALRHRAEIWQYDRAQNQVQATATLEGQPAHLVLANAKLYAALDSANGDATNRIAVLDAESMQAIGTVTVQSQPVALATSADGSRVFVANRSSDWISVIDTGTDAVVAEFPLVAGGDPAAAPVYKPVSLALSQDGSTLWVGCEGISQVRAYNSADGALLAEISVRPFPGQIALSVDGSKLYVPNRNSDRLTRRRCRCKKWHRFSAWQRRPAARSLRMANTFSSATAMPMASTSRAVCPASAATLLFSMPARINC